jgi:hypothetical protein
MSDEGITKVRSALWQFIAWAVALVLQQIPWGQARWLFYILFFFAVAAGSWMSYSYLKTVRIHIDASKPRRFATSWLEGAFKGIILAFPITLVGAISWLSWKSAQEIPHDSSSRYSEILVSMKCTPVWLPFRVAQGEPVYAVYLHPKWGNELVIFVFRSKEGWTMWPEAERKVSQVGYRCELVNDGAKKLLTATALFRVEFRGEARSQRARTIEIGLPESIDPKKSFVFHLVDDSRWDPRVTLPERIYGRTVGETTTRSIEVQYSTREGTPMHLAGFSP